MHEMGKTEGRGDRLGARRIESVLPFPTFFPLLFSNRKCSKKAGWSCEHFHHLFHRAFSSNATIHPTYPQASEHPGSQPLHCDWPYAHGDCGGYLPQAGTAAVPGYTQWVRALWWNQIGLGEERECREIKERRAQLTWTLLALIDLLETLRWRWICFSHCHNREDIWGR